MDAVTAARQLPPAEPDPPRRAAPPFARVNPGLSLQAVYVVELSLKLSPMPVSVQRKELGDAQALYDRIKNALESGQPRVIELTCEKAEEKRVSLLSSELVALQIYEKSAAGGGGSKRPGFSFDT
ncbi:MAG: hypothetical protein DCF24_13460 [Cyanobium sp.]|nr:MAG: hypothetical protein DCF24_13460 [Cyanobium sp.]PZV01714.1 MAG: hypothetical protein DCF23_12715 [Cyanobium sp.]